MNQPQTVLQALGGLGVTELILILLIVLLVFGAGKLPQIGDALGRGIRNFKSATKGQKDEAVDVTPKALEDKDAAKKVTTVEATEKRNA
ncbi:MAG: twin-arginine translocase TatA/TatE family subunit [Deltaproteobacteria bacterium]|nr:twin-arginine translocase TatA/TatE family subunit [Deltaproteobacteria bacterium]